MTREKLTALIVLLTGTPERFVMQGWSDEQVNALMANVEAVLADPPAEPEN